MMALQRFFTWFFLILTSTLLLFSTAIFAQQTTDVITVKTKETFVKQDPDKTSIVISAVDKFSLSADYFPGDRHHGAVLLLPDCQHDKKLYDQLGRTLKRKGIHALTLDLRGYGASTTTRFSHKLLKKNAKDIMSYQNNLIFITSFWPKDGLSAIQFLRSKIEKNKQIAVVSSGCSAAMAISLAEKTHLAGLVLMTPTLDYMEKENYKNLNDIATFFVGSSHQPDSYKTVKELFDWNGYQHSEMQLFNGNQSGSSLLLKNKSLADNLVYWLEHRLH